MARAKKNKPAPRILRVRHVPGRPAMNGPGDVSGAEAWALMTLLVEAQLALAGLEAVVDRSAVRVLRDRPFSQRDDDA